MPLPYGLYTDDHNGIDFEFPDEDLAAIVTRFVADAREALPNEHAAWGVWDEQKQLLTYRPLVAIAAGPGGISFHRPRLDGT
jgi:PRTRC genetic system protein A